MHHAEDRQERQDEEEVYDDDHVGAGQPQHVERLHHRPRQVPGDYDVKNTTPTPSTPSTLYPAEQANDCPAKMMGLSYDWTALKNKVDELQPNGMTNQPIGLAWAWMALTQGAPLSPPAKTADMQQAIILFSDGLNTENRWWREPGAKIDNRQALALHQRQGGRHHDLHRAGELGLLQGDEGLRLEAGVLLRDHARGQTVAAFNAIGTSLTKLRLAE